MTNFELATKYFGAWVARDANAILATLGPDGTYEDPGTRGPIRGGALRTYTEELWDGYIESVTGYFDSAAVPQQLDLDVIVQPKQIGPFAFGTSVVVQSGKKDVPGAFSITHLEARGPNEVEQVREISRASLIDMLKIDGFISATTVATGTRMVTVTAWKDTASVRRVMCEGAHAAAMKRFYAGELADVGRTSVWTLERDNGVMIRCPACGHMTRSPEIGAACRCGAPMPDAPPFW